MPLGSEINVDPAASGTPQTVAAETINSDLYQGVLVCDSSGNIQGSTTNPLNANHPDATTSSTVISTGGSVPLALGGGATTAFVSITGTWVGTLAYQISGDGTTFTAVNAVNSTNMSVVTSTTVNRDVWIPVSGVHTVRVVATAWTSGTANVTIRAGQGPTLVTIANTNTGPATVRLSDGTAALIGQKAMAGSLPVVVASDQSLATELPVARTPADSLAPVSCPDTGGPNYLYNGTTLDLERNDVEMSCRASAIHNPGAENGPDITAHNAESLLLILNVTTVASNGSMVVAVQGKHQLSGAYFTYWTAELPIRTTGTFTYFFANGASGGDFTECQAFGLAPRIWRYQTTVSTAAVTYSVSCVMGDN